MENLGTVFFQKFECLLMNNRELKFKWSKNFSEESRGAMKKNFHQINNNQSRLVVGINDCSFITRRQGVMKREWRSSKDVSFHLGYH